MQISVKLYPPYRKKGSSGELKLSLNKLTLTLGELAFCLEHNFKGELDFPLFDQHHLLTAEFMVNGKHRPLDFILSGSEEVLVIPYLCGG